MQTLLNPSKVFIFLYLAICLVPISGSADIAMTQMVYLSGLNTLCIAFFSFYKGQEFKNSLREIVGYKPILLYVAFLIWGFISLYKSVNFSESFRVLFEQINFITAFILFLYNAAQLKLERDYVVNVFIFILLLELLAILFLVVLDVKSGTFNLANRTSSYKGLTGNINIAAFSIVLKLPFLFYKAYKKRLVLLGYVMTFVAAFIIIYLHKTRAAILTLIAVGLSLVCFVFYEYRTKKILNKRLLGFVLILGIIFSINRPLNSAFNSNQSVTARLATLNTEDTSVGQRLRYYTQAFETFTENPVLGVGIGNWEIYSIEKDAENIIGYTVPYHAHNDFLEILAETGLPGFILYFSVLLLPLFYVAKAFLRERNVTYLFFMLPLIVYLLDSTFNFPFARPIQQLNLIGVLSLLILYLGSSDTSLMSTSKPIPNISSSILIFLILGLPFALYSSVRVYNAYTQHYYLLGQFNANTYTQEIETITAYEETYPSLMPTTIPVATMKGMFHIRKEENYEIAKEYFKKGMKHNPYLKLSETMLSYCYLMQDSLDKAEFHAKNAFEKMPKNPIHFVHYILALQTKRDTLGIIKAKDRISAAGFKEEIIDQLYLQAMANMLDKDNSKMVINDISRNLLNTNNDKLKGSVYVLEYGKEMVKKAYKLHLEGQKLFGKKKFLEAAEKFEEASTLNQLEIPYHENAINAYMQHGDYEKALALSNKLLDEIKLSPKIKYMKSIILFSLERNEEACSVLRELMLDTDTNIKIPIGLYNNYCN